jgi:uncharacterized damage-inducible protein DinB
MSNKSEPTALDKAKENYLYIYESLEKGLFSGAFNFAVAAEVFHTCQVIELYLNRLIAVEKNIKNHNIPQDPPITAKDAQVQLGKLYEAFEMAHAKNAYKVQQTITTNQHFSELKAYLSKCEVEEERLVAKKSEPAASTPAPAPEQDNIAP